MFSCVVHVFKPKCIYIFVCLQLLMYINWFCLDIFNNDTKEECLYRLRKGSLYLYNNHIKGFLQWCRLLRDISNVLENWWTRRLLGLYNEHFPENCNIFLKRGRLLPVSSFVFPGLISHYPHRSKMKGGGGWDQSPRLGSSLKASKKLGDFLVKYI